MIRKIVLCAVLVVSACDVVEVQTQAVRPSPAMIETAQKEINAQLRDPGSAQYRSFAAYKIGEGETLLCGEINAKNGFGGYVGFRSFTAIFDSGADLLRLVVDGLNGGVNASLTCEAASNGSYFR